jgi:hypothetical protein
MLLCTQVYLKWRKSVENSDFNHLRAKVLSLSHADRAALAQELIASLGTQQPVAIESDYQRRMRNYIDRSWLLAANTLTSYAQSDRQIAQKLKA